MKKKSFDLYAILQTHKEATPKEIQKSFHALSKKCHPDIGGNPEEFQRINAAYEILCDPDKRAFYDRTGCIKQPENEIYAIAAKIIADTIEKFLQSNRQNIFKLDFIGKIINDLEKEKRNIDEKRKIVRKNIKIINKLKKKLSRKETDSKYPPVVFQFFEQKKAEFVNVLLQLNEAISYNKIAILILQEYEFDYDKDVNSQSYTIHFSFGESDFNTVSF